DAVHDEAGLRAVPAAPRRSRQRQGVVHLLLLQPGPAPRRGRLRQPSRPPAAEHGAGEADEFMADAAALDGAGGGAGRSTIAAMVESLMPHDLMEVGLRLLVATLIGSAIGLDREVRRKPAGMR